MPGIEFRRWCRLVDSAAAVGLATVVLVSAAVDTAGRSEGVTRDLNAPAVAFLLAMALPLAVRRRVPRGTVVVTVAGASAAVLLGYPVGIGPFGAVFAMASLSYTNPGRQALRIGVPAAAVLLTCYLAAPGSVSATSVVGNALFIGFAIAAGVLLRARNEQRSELVVRNSQLQAMREVQIQSAVSDERMRIAREVHDAVGHSLVAITLQARAGQRRLAHDPTHADSALRQIESLAQQALDETRTAVATIRADAAVPAAPGPRLTDITDLVAAMRAPDVQIDLDVDIGHPLPPEHERAAYRIVQESLSNVARHARPARARVAIVTGDDLVTVTITNDGTYASPSAAGCGLLGMRERAERLGGTFVAGPTPDGWRVVVRLPSTSDWSVPSP